MNVPAKDIAKLLGGEKALGRVVRDYADLDAVIEAGLSAKAVNAIHQIMISTEVGIPDTAHFAVTIHRAVEAATVSAASKGVVSHSAGLFAPKAASPERSRKLERLARLYALAERVFDDKDYANAFLRKPHSLLNGRAPIECVETELATKQVEQILNAIAYGLPA